MPPIKLTFPGFCDAFCDCNHSKFGCLPKKRKEISFLKATCHVGGVKPRTGAGECHPTLQHLALHFSCRSVLRRPAKNLGSTPGFGVFLVCCNSIVFVLKWSCLTWNTGIGTIWINHLYQNTHASKEDTAAAEKWEEILGVFCFVTNGFNRSSLCRIYLIGEVVFCCDVFVFKNSLLVMNSFDQCKYSNCFPYWNGRRVLREDSPSVRSGFGNLGEPAGLWTHFGNMGWFHGFNCIQFWFNCHSGSFL